MKQAPVEELLSLEKLNESSHLVDMSLEAAHLKWSNGKVKEEKAVLMEESATVPLGELSISTDFLASIPKKLLSSKLESSKNPSAVQKITQELKSAKNEMEFNKNNYAFEHLVAALQLYQQI